MKYFAALHKSILFFTICFVSACNASNNQANEIKGIDSNNNGIRDDVDTYIAKQPYSTKQLDALRQYARSEQSIVVFTSNNREDARVANKIVMNAMNCIYNNFPSSTGQDSAAVISTQISELTFNNEARKKAEHNHAVLISGMTFSLPEGNTCE